MKSVLKFVLLNNLKILTNFKTSFILKSAELSMKKVLIVGTVDSRYLDLAYLK